MARNSKLFEPRESEIASAVLDHWRRFALPQTLVASIPNQRAFGQAGLTPGLPDLMVLTPKIRIGFIELKTARGKLSLQQQAIRNLLEDLGIRYVIAHGRDEPIFWLEEWGAVRKQAAKIGLAQGGG